MSSEAQDEGKGKRKGPHSKAPMSRLVSLAGKNWKTQPKKEREIDVIKAPEICANSSSENANGGEISQGAFRGSLFSEKKDPRRVNGPQKRGKREGPT